MTDLQPTILAEEVENGMINRAIRVIGAHHGQKLHEMSRINFGKIYTVNHNMKVMDIGNVAVDDMHLLVEYFKRSLSVESRT